MKTTTTRTVSALLEEVYKTTEIPDADDNLDRLNDYTHEATHSFIEEWSRNEGIENVPEEVREAVMFKIEENAGKDWWDRHRGWLLGAIENSMTEAVRVFGKRATDAFGEVNESKGIVSIVIKKPFLSVWRAAVEGQGYAAWGGDEKISDVKSATMVLTVLDDLAEVYGYKSIKTFYFNEVEDRWEPETGSYSELARIARKAMEGK